jgi:hypothetical protein
MSTINTAHRIFVAQLTRDLLAREALAADAIAPGAKRFSEAFRNFGNAIMKMSRTGGPLKSSALFRATCDRLRTAYAEQFFFTFSYNRSRSAYFELLTFAVEPHPLIPTGDQGVVVRTFRALLRRNGSSEGWWGERAFLSWHALARLAERGPVNLDARGIVATCGLVGHLMSKSRAHDNTNINLAISDDITLVGVLRAEDGRSRFFDVLTTLSIADDAGPRKIAQRDQGRAIGRAVLSYVESGNSNPRGFCDGIAVLPFDGDDFISRELKQRA